MIMEGGATVSMTSKLVLGLAVVVAYSIASRLISSLRLSRALSKYPIVNEKWDAAAKKQFHESADAILAKGVTLVWN